jgi:TPR repeat protein
MIKIISILLLSITFVFGNNLAMDNNENKEEKLVYKDMLAYLSMSNDNTQFAVLGSLYATGTTVKDSNGDIIKQDIFLAEKYLLKSANMGNYHSLTILAGFIILNENMRKLDPDLIKAEDYLKKSYKANDLSAGLLLSNIYFTKESYKKGLNILLECASKNDADAQLALALLFKDGMADKNGKMIFDKNIKTAEFYLNKACTNENKSDKVKDMCYNNPYIEKTVKQNTKR